MDIQAKLTQRLLGFGTATREDEQRWHKASPHKVHALFGLHFAEIMGSFFLPYDVLSDVIDCVVSMSMCPRAVVFDLSSAHLGYGIVEEVANQDLTAKVEFWPMKDAHGFTPCRIAKWIRQSELERVSLEESDLPKTTRAHPPLPKKCGVS